MKVVIIEDESLASERLHQMLTDADASVEIMATLQSVESSVKWLKGNAPPDVIFSDIRLLDGLCFQIFEEVPVDVPVIFTTAYDQYAIKAFELNSIDYLLKPVKKEKLMGSLEKLKKRRQPSAAADFSELLKLLKHQQPEYKSRFMVRLGQKIVTVPVDKIAYFYSENKLTFLVTKDNKKFPLDQPLEDLESILDPKSFFRINRQFIITFDSIAEMHPHFKGRIKLILQPTASEEIIISSERTPEFKSWIDK